MILGVSGDACIKLYGLPKDRNVSGYYKTLQHTSFTTNLLFAHSTVIFIIASIELGNDLKFFEIEFLTCWEDQTCVTF